MSFFDGNGLVQNSDIPFYPPPNDASAGACCQFLPLKNVHKLTGRSSACNIGYVYGNLSAVGTMTQSSSCEVIAGGDNTTLYTCECCEFSWPISK